MTCRFVTARSRDVPSLEVNPAGIPGRRRDVMNDNPAGFAQSLNSPVGRNLSAATYRKCARYFAGYIIQACF